MHFLDARFCVNGEGSGPSALDPRQGHPRRQGSTEGLKGSLEYSSSVHPGADADAVSNHYGTSALGALASRAWCRIDFSIPPKIKGTDKQHVRYLSAQMFFRASCFECWHIHSNRAYFHYALGFAQVLDSARSSPLFIASSTWMESPHSFWGGLTLHKFFADVVKAS